MANMDRSDGVGESGVGRCYATRRLGLFMGRGRIHLVVGGGGVE